MTIKGAQQLLQKNKEGTANTFEAVKKLLDIKEQLIAIRNELGEESNEEEQ
jgi:hypothetical protein